LREGEVCCGSRFALGDMAIDIVAGKDEISLGLFNDLFLFNTFTNDKTWIL
jgi:hypothetical protein